MIVVALGVIKILYQGVHFRTIKFQSWVYPTDLSPFCLMKAFCCKKRLCSVFILFNLPHLTRSGGRIACIACLGEKVWSRIEIILQDHGQVVLFKALTRKAVPVSSLFFSFFFLPFPRAHQALFFLSVTLSQSLCVCLSLSASQSLSNTPTHTDRDTPLPPSSRVIWRGSLFALPEPGKSSRPIQKSKPQTEMETSRESMHHPIYIHLAIPWKALIPASLSLPLLFASLFNRATDTL